MLKGDTYAPLADADETPRPRGCWKVFKHDDSRQMRAAAEIR